MYPFFKHPQGKNAFLLALALLSFYAFVLLPLDPFQILKLKLEDFLFRTTFLAKKLPPELDEIVLVVLDDEAFAKVNQRWPWERTVYGELIEKISAQKPRLILLDLTFVGESKEERTDRLFAESLQKAGNVIISYYFSEFGKPVPPLPMIREASLDAGFVNKPLDKDFTIRRARAAYRTVDGKLLDYAIEVKAAAHYFGSRPRLSEKENLLTFQKKTDAPVTARGWKMPMRITKEGILPINYQARPEQFPTYSIWSILSDQVPPHALTDKFVIVGITNRIMHDIHHSPFGSIAGVYIFANLFLMILSGAYVVQVGFWINLLLFFLIGLATALATYKLPPWRGFLFLFYEVAIFLGITFFLYSKNIRLDFSSVVTAAILSYLGSTFYKYLCLLFENVSLKEEAITDGLTQLYAYRYFELRLRNEFERAQRYRTPLSLVFVDIDHFKRVNDTYGHEEGNAVLKTIAGILKKNTRRVDLVARYGGEEFCAILPQTDLEGARQYAENLRKAVEETSIPLNKTETLKVTVSIGVSSYPRFPLASSEELVKLTDQALYLAKQGGRNQVCIPMQEPPSLLTPHPL
ncbi:MAG: diguanylate cyclase [Candidatus Omnitrophica bacterium]|nr:diguanylate cyclase [Candidatus Omnitrophota bacterium]